MHQLCVFQATRRVIYAVNDVVKQIRRSLPTLPPASRPTLLGSLRGTCVDPVWCKKALMFVDLEGGFSEFARVEYEGRRTCLPSSDGLSTKFWLALSHVLSLSANGRVAIPMAA
jgi:hypothetical protein